MADGSSPQFSDGFKNVVAGLAAGNAKIAAGHYVTGTNIAEADAAFRASTWYGKILTIPADDAVREWRAWQGDNDQIEALEREEKRLGYRLRIRDALINARHQGGCVIIPGGLPGNPSTPLNLDRITTGSLQFLHVLGPEEITPGQIVRNPLSPDFGKPEYWEIRGEGSQLRIHPSRAVLVNGRRVPGSTLRSGTVWGDSIWMHLADAIMAADAGAAVISALMHEAKIDIVKIPGMTEMMASAAGEQAVMRRWTLAAQMKSIANVMLLDGGPLTGDGSRSEEWDQKQVTWSGLPDVQRTLLQIMSGAADIPMTRLTGEQQTGLSGADEGSTRHYYDMIGARQSLDIEPAIAAMDEMLIRSALGSRPADLWYTWRPLWKATAKELAEIDKLEAEAASLYARDALVPTEALEAAVQNRMIESGRWPGLEAALDAQPEDDGEGADMSDAAPRTLYVRRDVLNGDEIIAWAKVQGFETTLPADDLHVTIAFSRAPIDWMKAGEAWQSKIELPEGGPRVMDQFGDAKVLLFRSHELEWRHDAIKSAGASWDHPEYQPHITISYGPMPADVEPYRGKIVLGPEIFEEVNEKWMEGIKEQ